METLMTHSDGKYLRLGDLILCVHIEQVVEDSKWNFGNLHYAISLKPVRCRISNYRRDMEDWKPFGADSRYDTASNRLEVLSEGEWRDILDFYEVIDGNIYLFY